MNVDFICTSTANDFMRHMVESCKASLVIGKAHITFEGAEDDTRLVTYKFKVRN